MREAIRVAIVSRNDVSRLGFEQVVRQAPGYELVASGDGPSVVVDGPAADVTVVAIDQDDEIADLREIVAACPRVVCFGRPERRAGAVGAGVAGFLAAVNDASEVIELIGLIAAGGTYLPEDGFPPGLLSPREREVLVCLAGGCTDRQIGEQLGISVRTVQSHLDRIREKTGRRRRADLTMLALEMGLMQPR